MHRFTMTISVKRFKAWAPLNGPLLMCCIALASWQSCTYLPEPGQENGGLEVRETAGYIEIVPSGGNDLSSTGFIFYPGGLVDPHAYEGLCAGIALSGRGRRVLIAKMPANLAVLASGSAKKIIRDF